MTSAASETPCAWLLMVIRLTLANRYQMNKLALVQITIGEFHETLSVLRALPEESGLILIWGPAAQLW
jgi:hypothetical protein